MASKQERDEAKQKRDMTRNQNAPMANKLSKVDKDLKDLEARMKQQVIKLLQA